MCISHHFYKNNDNNKNIVYYDFKNMWLLEMSLDNKKKTKKNRKRITK